MEPSAPQSERFVRPGPTSIVLLAKPWLRVKLTSFLAARSTGCLVENYQTPDVSLGSCLGLIRLEVKITKSQLELTTSSPVVSLGCQHSRGPPALHAGSNFPSLAQAPSQGLDEQQEEAGLRMDGLRELLESMKMFFISMTGIEAGILSASVERLR